jgi:alpha-ketoglutarate-dependent taurine dioxygenase
LLGDLVPHPTEMVREGSMGILELDAAAGNGKADQWHTDVTFVDAYPRYSILRAVRPNMAATRCGRTRSRPMKACHRS